MSTRLAYMDTPVDEIIAAEGVEVAINKKHVGSVLFSYRCSLSCLHCCFNCSPQLPNTHVSIDQGVEYLRQLHELDRCIHIAGGEAMLFWPELLEICDRAGREGKAPHFIESNTTWCVSDEITRDRLTRLRDTGVQGILISADPYHQLDCPPERYLRCRDAAFEIFGPPNVAGKARDEEVHGYARIARDPDAFAAYARNHYVVLSGRAGNELARYRDERPIADLALDEMWHGPESGMHCRMEFEPDTLWEIHLDPYGNIQTLCGLIVGNMNRTSLPERWREGFLDDPLIEAVHRAGPVGLIPFAEERGYVTRPAYAQKCHLCWELRKFLRPHYPQTIGPAEIYGR